MSDIDAQRMVEDFGNAERPVRLLLCSDVASEGINLHYHCHRLIHFDLPWSLMVFPAAQRAGRSLWPGPYAGNRLFGYGECPRDDPRRYAHP